MPTYALRPSDLTDTHPGSFAVQQRTGFAPDAFACAVELMVGDPVDRGAGADLGDPKWHRRLLELSEYLP